MIKFSSERENGVRQCADTKENPLPFEVKTVKRCTTCRLTIHHQTISFTVSFHKTLTRTTIPANKRIQQQ
jgi:hypothetical protein